MCLYLVEPNEKQGAKEERWWRTYTARREFVNSLEVSDETNAKVGMLTMVAIGATVIVYMLWAVGVIALFSDLGMVPSVGWLFAPMVLALGPIAALFVWDNIVAPLLRVIVRLVDILIGAVHFPQRIVHRVRFGLKPPQRP